MFFDELHKEVYIYIRFCSAKGQLNVLDREVLSAFGFSKEQLDASK